MTPRTLPPLARYELKLTRGELVEDIGQRAAIEQFDTLYRACVGETTAPKRGLLRWRSKTADGKHGLYLWGDVGRGKSMLMDVFVESIKHQRKTRRVHFHAFMLDVHQRLHALRTLERDGDLMEKLVHALREECDILCLDEFQVSDVGDAMILARLFGKLFEEGMVVIFTSNRTPSDLYQGGLQRDQFLHFVHEVLMPHVPIVEIQSPVDFRLQYLQSLRKTYMFPRDSAADDFLLESWKKLTQGAPSEPLELKVLGRNLLLEKHVGGVVWCTFGELCVRPLGAADYLAIARIARTVLLQGIPALTREERNEAKRFVTLIDTLYDHRVKVICTAATPPEGIYAEGDGTFEFARTVSRLHEMQSDSYLCQPKIPVTSA